jgi:hypothetical protein
MTNFEKIKQMSIDEMARSCMNFFRLPVWHSVCRLRYGRAI